MPDITPYRLTKQQAAAFLAISEKTLDRRVAAGDIPAYREGARQVMFKRADLEAYADNTPAWEPQGAAS
jgi:excisionase family DNA binding protein